MPAPKPAVPFEEDAPRPQIQDLAIDDVKRHPQLQTRERPAEHIISDYQDAMEAGAEFPPLLVFLVGNDFLLVDGDKRIEAARRVDRTTVRCEVRRGSLRDAILASCEVNAKHGERRTNPDKRRAVAKLLQDQEWGQWTDREIARRCAVHHELVGRVRAELAPVTGVSASERTYRTKHGTVAAMNVVAIGKRSEDQATPPPPIRQTPHRPEDAGAVVRLTAPPSPAGEPVDLAAELENRRAEFFNALAQIEKLAKEMTLRIPAVRGNLASNSATAGRMMAAAEEINSGAKRLMRA
jgi:hypothetical protein